MDLPKHVHIIGICGVATGALAVAFQRRGAKVTGSDKGFFPPVSTELERHGIVFYAGWHPEKMIADGIPDTVIVGTASGSQNPETAYAREHRIPVYSFAEAIGHFFVKEKSIVCSGTWGKTSSSALLSFILDKAGLDPTYMFGGISLSHESSARLSDSSWSVFEGDEYKSSPTDLKAKFFYYKPTHLLLTAVSWDHADLYPTEEAYFETFRKLLIMIPADGFVLGCADQAGVMKLLDGCTGTKILYGRAGQKQAAYTYSQVMQNQNGLDLVISHAGRDYRIHSPLLGLYQAENITACFAMASELGVQPDIIISAIAGFAGMKRRMEKRLDGTTTPSGVTIIDDIAHSPEKAGAILSTVRAVYDGKIIAVFEPNIGGRRRESVAKYDDAFRDADTVIIPRLTKLKVAEDNGDAKNSSSIEGRELADIILKTHPDATYIDDDATLVATLRRKARPGDVIVFLGSHGFRGMIEASVASLKA